MSVKNGHRADQRKARDAVGINHEEWQTQVMQLAGMLGWKHLHVRRTVGRGRRWVTATNRDGWPDLFLWHPARGFAGVELKVGRDKPTAEQLEVLAELAAAGARTMVAYPDDLAALHTLLAMRPRTAHPGDVASPS